MSEWNKMLWRHDLIAFLVCLLITIIPVIIHILLCAIVNLHPGNFSKTFDEFKKKEGE